jgi:hypothetical protein
MELGLWARKLGRFLMDFGVLLRGFGGTGRRISYKSGEAPLL